MICALTRARTRYKIKYSSCFNKMKTMKNKISIKRNSFNAKFYTTKSLFLILVAIKNFHFFFSFTFNFSEFKKKKKKSVNEFVSFDL